MKGVGRVGMFVLVAVFALTQAASAGMLIHYSFDDEAVGVATNTVGGNGTIGGNSVYTSTAMVGSHALSFDGNGDYIENIDLGTQTAYTMSFWYNTPNAQACCGNGGLYYTTGNWENDSLHSSLTSGSSGMWSEIHSGNQRSSGSVTTALNTWNHIVASFSNGAITYIVNGVESPVGSQTMSGLLARLGVGRIGAWNTSRYYTGIFDDWAIWDEGLSPVEGTSVYNLATSALNYNAYNADNLFHVYDGTLASVDIGGLTWVPAAAGSLTGSPGSVVDLGGGNYGLILDGNGGGVMTQSQVAAVPEPSTFVLAALGLLGLAFCARRRG